MRGSRPGGHRIAVLAIPLPVRPDAVVPLTEGTEAAGRPAPPAEPAGGVRRPVAVGPLLAAVARGAGPADDENAASVTPAAARHPPAPRAISDIRRRLFPPVRRTRLRCARCLEPRLARFESSGSTFVMCSSVSASGRATAQSG